MKKKMTGSRWTVFLKSCINLRNFIKTHLKDIQQQDEIGDLPKFDLENLISDSFYKSKLKNDFQDMSSNDMDKLGENLRNKMTAKTWRSLLHWILVYETEILYMDPPPPPQAVPQTLFDFDFEFPEKEYEEFLIEYPVPDGKEYFN